MLILRRLLLIMAALLLAWRAVVTGVAAHYLAQPNLNQADTLSTVAAWSPGHPEVVLQQALKTAGDGATNAEAGLVEAYAKNPSDTRPLWAMARLAQQKGDSARADALAILATRLNPASSQEHQRAAAFWASRDNVDRALQHWDLAMRADRSSEPSIFPMLKKIAETPGLRPALRPYTNAPPPWWERFFSHFALNSTDIEGLRSLYALRRESGSSPPSARERRIIVRTLRESGRIAEAYIAWVNSLSDGEREQLGWINNGSFELTPTNAGFDWHVIPTENVSIEASDSDAIDGRQALHLNFSGTTEKHTGLYQPLFLDPGRYRVTGASRSDGTGPAAAIRWNVQCLKPHTRQLGFSKLLNGSNEWENFSFNFEVPADCAGQLIRLLSTESRASSGGMQRDLWIDGIAIRQARPEQQALSTEAE